MAGLARRGYRVVYLTARSMAQEEDTKAFLFSTVKNQEGKSLPAGPVIFSPTSFISGLIAEVVTGSPHVQKTKMIQELWATFKSENRTDINDVIVAAYGNKETDTKAYLQSGLWPQRVFIVNPQGRKLDSLDRQTVSSGNISFSGELKNVGTGQVSSYQTQAEIIDTLFP